MNFRYEDALWDHEYADETTIKQVEDFWRWFRKNNLSTVCTGSSIDGVNSQILHNNEMIIYGDWNKIFK